MGKHPLTEWPSYTDAKRLEQGCELYVKGRKLPFTFALTEKPMSPVGMGTWGVTQICLTLEPSLHLPPASVCSPFLHERIVPWEIRVIETSANKKWIGRKDTRVERIHDASYIIAVGWSHSVILCLFITLWPLVFQIPRISPILFRKSHNMIEDLQGYVKNEAMDSGDGCTLLS